MFALTFSASCLSWTASAQDYVPQRIVASDATPGDRFGWSVAMFDSTAIVGAPGSMDGAGAAYVLRRQPNNEWIEVQKLVPGDAVAGAEFGWSVALTDSLAVVGEPYANGNGDLRAGAVHVYRLGADGRWNHAETLTPSSRVDASGFGWSVALAPVQRYNDLGEFGPIVFVGAPWRSGGTVHVFERTAEEAWIETSFPSPWGGDDDRFGWAVSILTTRAYAGSPGAPREDGLDGKAHGFVRDTDGWRLSSEIVPPEGLLLHEFGHAVADRAWVGASGGSEADALAGFAQFQGRLNPSDPDSFVVIPASVFRAEDLGIGSTLGSSIAVGTEGPYCCGHMIVGAPSSGVSGRALIMAGGAGFLVGPAGILEPPSDFQGGAFGTSVAASRGVFAVGAPGDSGTTPQVGEVYLFTNSQELTASEQPGPPHRLRVEGHYPNPTRGESRLRLHLGAPARVTLRLFDMQGRERSTHDHGMLAPGIHDITLDTRALPPGVYAYTVEAAGEVVRGTIVVVR